MLKLSRLELSRMKIQFNDCYLELFKDAENELQKIGQLQLSMLNKAKEYVSAGLLGGENKIIDRVLTNV